MCHKILENYQIQGVTVGDLKYLMVQFMDDTVLFINFDLSVLNHIGDTFDVIETNTELKINYDKTTIYRIGSLKHSKAKLYTKKTFHGQMRTLIC